MNSNLIPATNKAIFLDRDGTLNVDKGYLYRIEDFEWLPGVLEALRLFQDEGFKLFVLTNQSGIARGYYSEADFLKLNQWMLERLEEKGIHIEKAYYCPHHPEATNAKYRKECDCRKPKTGMFEQAIREFNIDVRRSYVIGDKLRDCCLCRKHDCRGFLIGNKESKDIIHDVRIGKYERIRYCRNLLACAKEICEGTVSANIQVDNLMEPTNDRN